MNWTHYIHIPRNEKAEKVFQEDYDGFEEEDFDIVELDDDEYALAMPLIGALNAAFGLHIATAEETVLTSEFVASVASFIEHFQQRNATDGFRRVKQKFSDAFRLAADRKVPIGLDF